MMTRFWECYSNPDESMAFFSISFQHGESSGGELQTGGAVMIASDDAFLLFRKSANQSTPMRFDGQSSLYSFSLTGTFGMSRK